MSTHIQQIKHVGGDGRMITRTTRVDEDNGYMERDDSRPASYAARVVWYAAGVLLTLLAFRFILALLGANPGNAFADFIYTTSHPFVAPFFSLFGYDLRYGVSRFESYTLVAMAVYALVAFGISRLFTLKRDAEADSRME